MKHSSFKCDTSLDWNTDTDFPVFFDLFAFVALTKTAGICIIISVSVAKDERRQGAYFTKIFKAQIHCCIVAGLVGCVQPIVLIGFANMPALLDRPLSAST